MCFEDRLCRDRPRTMDLTALFYMIMHLQFIRGWKVAAGWGKSHMSNPSGGGCRAPRPVPCSLSPQSSVGSSPPRNGQGPKAIISFRRGENGLLLGHFLLPLLPEGLEAEDLEQTPLRSQIYVLGVFICLQSSRI